MSLLHRDKQAGASLRECTWMNLVFISFCNGLKVNGTIFRTWQCFKWDVGDVSNLGRIPWVSRTYWRFIDFSKDTLGISMYTYAPEKRNGQPTLVAYLLAASLTGLCDSNQFSEVLQGLLLGCLANFWNVFWGWLVEQPFSKREFFSHWTVLCSQLTWRTDCYARWIQFELLAGGEAVRAPASSTGNLESDNLFFAQKCGLKSLVAHLQRLRCATLWDGGTGRCCIPWCKGCGPEALPLASPLVHSLFASNFLLKHIAVLHFDGIITNHKEIGLGHLASSWLQDDVFTLPNWQAWALMELYQRLLETLWWVYTIFTEFCSKFLESANLLSKSSVTRQGDSMAW